VGKELVYIDAAGSKQAIDLGLDTYKNAAERGQSVPQYLASTFPTDAAKYGSPFEQLCEQTGIFLKGNKDFGLRPSTVGEVLNPKQEAASITKEGVPASRILFPAVILGLIEDKLAVDLKTSVTGLESLIAVDDSIASDKFERPVLNFSNPEAARSAPVGQLALPQSMLTITASDVARKIPSWAIGLEISEQAQRSTTLDLVGLAVARQAAVESNEKAYGYILSFLNGEADYSISALRVVEDRVQETSTTTGTGGYSLLGATTSYVTFASKMKAGDSAYCVVEDVNASGSPTGGYETGIYTMGATGLLERTNVHSSSNAGAAVNWAAGTRRISMGLTSSQFKEVAAPDKRKLAKWFAGGIEGKKAVWVGDSTTEQLAFLGFINYDGSPTFIGSLFPQLLSTKHYNYGLNGALMAGFVQPGGNFPNSATPPLNTNISGVVTTKADLYIFCYGLNDMRGGIGPGNSGNPFGGNFPDYREAYGGSNMVAMALILQYWMKSFVTQVRATNPDCAIIFRMPNSANTDCVFMANGVTPQQMMDVLRLAYRGDPALNVPSPETFDEGILVWDAMATIYSEKAYSVHNDLIESLNDGLHPNVNAYRMMLLELCTLLTEPPAAALANPDEARRAAAREAAIAHGWQSRFELEAIRYSGMYKLLYTSSVGYNSASFMDMGFGRTLSSGDHMWGGALGTARASAAPTGLAIGDVIVWGEPGSEVVKVVKDLGNGNEGAIRWYSGVDIHGETLPSSIAVGTRGLVYRLDKGASVLAHRNDSISAKDGTL
jgi:hypothetical protein